MYSRKPAAFTEESETAGRHTIGAAMGIIMERYAKMRDLARQVCETGALDV
ncbi:hypothetical protein [Streptomyces sp. NRRL F-5126]|uniref:hypothetical protein n=1 Tax=Streptomyces sp. NRRL F-5126 TaxID=1463857 RepID=UPI000ABCB4EA|nr:hypothetical protein [Streptomyces sp. NRRL F-5126]